MRGSDFPKDRLPPESVGNPLAKITPLLKDSDISFANVEGTLCDGGISDKCDGSDNPCFAFRTPTRLARYFREAGIGVVSLANNHIMDFGEECREQTEKTLERLSILWSGRPGTVAHFEHGGKKIALIVFYTAEHSNNVNDLKSAMELVKSEKKRSDIVIVSFHGGAEGFDALHVSGKGERFYGEDRGNVKKFARGVVRAGADLVLGTGPHVPRAMEIYRGRLIAYSLGNLATYRGFSLWGFAGVSVLLEADLGVDGRFVAGRLIPLRLADFGTPVQDPSGIAVDLVRVLSRQDFPGSGIRVARNGVILPALKR